MEKAAWKPIDGADNLLGQLLWTNYFLKEQGYGAKETVLYQDNKSAMLLLENRKASSSKRTRHLNIQYFLCQTGLQTATSELSIVQLMT